MTSARIRTYLRFAASFLVSSIIIATLFHFGRGYLRLGEYAMSESGTVPMWSDEVVYHLNAKYFVHSHGFEDGAIIEELESKVGHFGTHGPMYNIIDGFTYKLFGDSFKVKIFSNIAIVLASVIIVLSTSGLTIPRRLALTLAPVTSFVTVNYTFCYMQEIVHIGLACVTWRLAWALSRQPLTTTKFLSALPVLLIASTARWSWILTMPVFAGLKHASKRTAWTVVALGALVIVGTVVTFPLINAPYPIGVLNSIGQYVSNGEYSKIIETISRNTSVNLRNFFSSPSGEAPLYQYNRLLYVAALLLTTCIGIFQRSRFALMSSLFGGLCFLALVTVYDTASWKEHRALAGPLVFMALTIISEVSLLFSCPFIVASVLIGSSAFETYARRFITFKKEHASALLTLEVPDVIQELRSTIRGGSAETVLLSVTMLIHDTKPFLMLPTVSDDNTPIRYTMNVLDASFKRHQRIPIKYAVFRPEEATAAGLQVTASGNSYHLYQFPDTSSQQQP